MLDKCTYLSNCLPGYHFSVSKNAVSSSKQIVIFHLSDGLVFRNQFLDFKFKASLVWGKFSFLILERWFFPFLKVSRFAVTCSIYTAAVWGVSIIWFICVAYLAQKTYIWTNLTLHKFNSSKETSKWSTTNWFFTGWVQKVPHWTRNRVVESASSKLVNTNVSIHSVY